MRPGFLVADLWNELYGLFQKNNNNNKIKMLKVNFESVIFADQI